jgi:hypothetical protein
MNGAELNGLDLNAAGGAVLPSIRLLVDGPLGAPAGLLELVALVRLSAPSPLGAPALLAEMVIPQIRLSAPSPLGAPALLASRTTRAPHHYRLTAYLSGSEDATTDYPFEISNFTINKRSGQPSFYSVVAPFTDALITALLARPNGKIHILRDGYIWEQFNLALPIRYDIGPTSASISLSGSRQVTITAASTMQIEPQHVARESVDSTGQLVLDLVPGTYDPRPTDTVNWDGVDYTVTLKKFAAGQSGQTLSINATPA